MENKLPRIGISQGDINGIGYELILKTLSDPMIMDICTPVIYGSPKIAMLYRKSLELQNFNLNQIEKAEDASEKKINIINTGDEDIKLDIAKSTPEAGKAAIAALSAMTKDAIGKKIDAMVTAPINRGAYNDNDIKFYGHNIFLQEAVGNNEKALPLMVNEVMKVATLTGHIALSEVSKQINQELIIDKVKILNSVLIKDFGIVKPRIGVLGLNPHPEEAPENSEEETIIRPAIKRLNDANILCFGPLTASILFGSGQFTRYDALLAMYHDQGLVPFNAISMDAGVKYTANLPIIRTAPMRGTEYEIAGKNEASEESFRNAIYLAVDTIRNRKSYETATANPLPVK